MTPRTKADILERQAPASSKAKCFESWKRPTLQADTFGVVLIGRSVVLENPAT